LSTHEPRCASSTAAGPAAAGVGCGTCATVYFGALCLCWDDESPSPRHLLLLAASFVALVSSVLLGAQLECLGAPRVTATSALVAFAALRLCPYEMSSSAPPADAGPSPPRQPPQAPPAPVGLSLQLETEEEAEVTREEALAVIRRIYRKVSPDKAQSAVELLERYPPTKWLQLLSLIRLKYGEDVETAALAALTNRLSTGAAAKRPAVAAPGPPAPGAEARAISASASRW
jgi:hypothetical protein